MSETKTEIKEDRLKKVSRVLVAQPTPSENSPYFKLADEFGLTIHFRPFIQVEPLELKEFKKQKINILDHSAVIFTSRNAVDNFFRICSESKIDVPAEMKYFCISEQTANYLQKYIVVRKRKIFVGKKTAKDLENVLLKHKDETFLYPCSNIRKDDIPSFLKKNNFKYNEAVIYRTVASDLSDLSDVNYDIIAFFSPSGVNSLYVNFPDFEQKSTRIAAFGPTTAKAVKDHGLVLDIQAPLPDAPSMAGAIEAYVKKANQK